MIKIILNINHMLLSVWNNQLASF